MPNNKYMKNYDINKESSYLQCWDINNLYGWAMLQQLPVNNFKRVKNISKFDEGFIKSYFEESDKDIFLKLMLNILKMYIIFTMIYHFYL